MKNKNKNSQPQTKCTGSYKKKSVSAVFRGYKMEHLKIFEIETCFNPLSSNPTKWSNTLKHFVGNRRQIVLVCLTPFCRVGP